MFAVGSFNQLWVVDKSGLVRAKASAPSCAPSRAAPAPLAFAYVTCSRLIQAPRATMAL